MSLPIGFRKSRVFEHVTPDLEYVLDNRGAFLYHEVTNHTASPVYFTPNDFPENGNRGAHIPIPPNETRTIPMAVYKFTASGDVTVVSYGQ